MIERRTVLSANGIAVELAFSRTAAHYASGDSNDTMTVNVVLDAACPGLVGSIVPGSYMFRLGRQDLVVGHRNFDDRFIVQCKSPALAKLWLTERLCDALLATYDPNASNPLACFFDGRGVSIRNRVDQVFLSANQALGGAIKLVLDPLPTFEQRPPNHPKQDAAIRVCEEFANRGAELALQLTQQLEPLGHVTAPQQFATTHFGTFAIQRGQSTVYVDFPWHVDSRRDHLRTRIRTSRNAGSSVENLDRSLRCLAAQPLYEWLDLGDDYIEVAWLGIASPSQLTHTVSMFLELSQSPSSPYRTA